MAVIDSIIPRLAPDDELFAERRFACDRSLAVAALSRIAVDTIMFTGIVETTGAIKRSTPCAGGRTLSVDAGIVADDAALGASIAVSGVCLTVTAMDGSVLSFDVIHETLNRTTLGNLSPGDRVNLERSLTPSTRMDGHIVQGHVDGTAAITRKIVSTDQWVLWLKPKESVAPYIIPKGSVAIDGISLTIAAVEDGKFSVAIIPTTLERTNLADRKEGDTVNIESDIIARTVVHHLSRIRDSGGISLDKLREQGFA